jgi:hypothetical protein
MMGLHLDCTEFIDLVGSEFMDTKSKGTFGILLQFVFTTSVIIRWDLR